MRVVDGMEYPCDVYFVGYDAGKTQYLERRVVGVHAHIYAECFAHGHDGRQEVPHVFAEGCTVDALVVRQ